MANQTVSVSRNLDDAAIAGLLNGEDITINTGAKLTINADNRWSQQAAVIGNITIDSGTGGSVLIDGRDVWWLPFDASSGNVPALGTLGVQNCTGGSSGATGEFLGVWTALGVVPSTAGSAMPATGFLKFRSKVGTFQDNETVTLPGGATVVVNSASGGQRGWIHIAGEQSQTITVPRLGLFEALGDWFELGETNGADSQTFQYPVADYCSAVQIETAPGSGVYEWWPAVGITRWAQNTRIAQDTRGKCINSTTGGVITIALRGAVNNGYKPVSGCKVRVPNIFVSSSTSTNWANNLLSAGGTSWDFTTTSAGAVKIDKTAGNWYLNFSQPYSVEITDSSIQGDLTISECATAPIVRRCCVGVPNNEDRSVYVFTSCFAGGTIEDCVGFKYEGESGDAGWTFSDCDGFTISGCKAMMCGDNTATTFTRGAADAYAMTVTRTKNTDLLNVTLIGGGISLNGASDILVSGVSYADCLENRTTGTSNGVSACQIQGASSRCIFEGPFTNFDNIANVHPYNNICIFVNSTDCEVRDIGTPAAPYDCGSANACGNAVNFGGNDLRCVARRVYVQNTRSGPVATVNTSSKGQAINVFGDYADVPAITALNFIFKGCKMTGSLAGQTSVYGTHWSDHFLSATTGRINMHANEPTADSADQCAITAGTPKFTSTGQVKLTTIGDQVTWTMPYFALGHTSLVSLLWTGLNLANHLLEFQYDTGSGFSAWQTLSDANLVAVGAIDPNTGVKLKIRATCTVANSGNQITYLTINTATNAIDQQIQYPLPGIQLTLTGLAAGSDVVVLAAGTDTILDQVDSVSSYTFDYVTPQNIDIGIIKPGYVPLYIRNYALGTENATLPVAQRLDPSYAA
jgi:hypothetical protein